MKETLLDRKVLYKGKLISLFKDTVMCSNGVKTSREIIDHSPAVVIIPVDEEGKITLIKQYRHAINEMLIECPAGCVDTDEDILKAAKRELAEECGLKASKWEFLHQGFPTPGFCNEIYHIFLAKNLSSCKSDCDHDEVISTFQVTFDEFESMIKSKKINDIKTILSYYILKSRKETL